MKGEACPPARKKVPKLTCPTLDNLAPQHSWLFSLATGKLVLVADRLIHCIILAHMECGMVGLSVENVVL